MMNSRPSLKDIAIQAGVSAMTVSRALRNDPRVLPITKKKILQLAETMGYQPDPNLRKMMGYMRKARVRTRSESIAFVWPDIEPRATAAAPHLQRMVQGARARAEEFGFGLDEFWLQETGMSSKRLCSIMNNRGIQCLILAPLFGRAHGHLKLDWARYSTVTTGLGLWRPQLHRVHFDHYDNTLMAMRKLAHQRCKRIAFVQDRVTNERMHRASSAAFLAHHPLGPAEAARLLMLTSKPSAEKICSFLEKQKPEGLIIGTAPYDIRIHPQEWWFKQMRALGKLPHAALSFSEEHPEIPGIDQRDALLGAYAVDMVVAQFHRGELGVPQHPKVMLCQGQWRDSSDY